MYSSFAPVYFQYSLGCGQLDLQLHARLADRDWVVAIDELDQLFALAVVHYVVPHCIEIINLRLLIISQESDQFLYFLTL